MYDNFFSLLKNIGPNLYVYSKYTRKNISVPIIDKTYQESVWKE